MALSTLARLMLMKVKKGQSLAKVIADTSKTLPKAEVMKAARELGGKVPKAKPAKKLTFKQKEMAGRQRTARAGARRERMLDETYYGDDVVDALARREAATARLGSARQRAGGIDLRGKGKASDDYRKFMSRKRFPRGGTRQGLTKADREMAFKFREWARKNGRVITNDESLAMVHLHKQRRMYQSMADDAYMTGGKMPAKPSSLIEAERMAGFPAPHGHPLPPPGMNPGLARLEANRFVRKRYEDELIGLSGNRPVQPRALDEMLDKFMK
jgi:hypothetical protein